MEKKMNEEIKDVVKPDDPLYQYSEEFRKELKGMHKESTKLSRPKTDLFSRIGNEEIKKNRI